MQRKVRKAVFISSMNALMVATKDEIPWYSSDDPD